jgi:hypothetical protein
MIARLTPLVVLAVIAGAAPARAASDMETILQDDPRIVYPQSDAALERTMVTVKLLGVDRIRVSVFWSLIAPDPRSGQRPTFPGGGPGSPASYPAGNWDRYDHIVRLAQKYDLGVMFSVQGHSPAWATSHKRAGKANQFQPNPKEFREFVAAVGTRYSGTYQDEIPAQAGPGGTQLGGVTLFPTSQPAQAAVTLPRVNHWSVWNEPNFPGWLAPVWRRSRTRDPNKLVAYSPYHYRRLVDAAWQGLRRTGHGGDVILIGETAPRGQKNPRHPMRSMKPIEFIRELYCMNVRYRLYRGRAARLRGCPTTARGRRSFASKHPLLFRASGWAHHAYPLQMRPTWAPRARESVPLGGLGRMNRAFDRVFFRWGSGEPYDIYLTEMGYQTRPDPYVGIPFNRQAAWNSWAEYLAYRTRRVRSWAQFLLVDDGPERQFASSERNFWRTWQSGLETVEGTRKPAFREFLTPIHVTPGTVRRGRRARVFGVYRPAANGAAVPVAIELRAAGEPWRVVRRLTVRSAAGYLLAHVRVNRTSRVRLVWSAPNGTPVATRAAIVKVR